MVKSGVLRLEDEVILFVRLQEFRNGFAAHPVFEHVAELLPEIRAPLPEIVIDVDHRHPGILGAASESSQMPRRRQCVLEQRITAFELHVVDDVDENQRDRALVRNVAIEIVVLGRHALP